jgi:hypothetical protein
MGSVRGGEVGRWGDGELGAPTPPREWGLGAMGSVRSVRSKDY